MTTLSRRRFLTLSAAMACAPSLAQAATWRGRALGAEVSVTLEGPRSAVDTALQEIPAHLDQIESLFSLYRPGSALSRLNTTGTLSPTPRFTSLMGHADRAHRLTGGLFDPTVQPLWQALATGTDPEAARAALGWSKLTRSDDRITLAPGQQLTFNGIAQGFATDLIRDRLAAAGFTRALVNIGEQAALGGPFTLGLNDPRHGHMGHVTLERAARATSSPGALTLGQSAHILGPKGERPLWSTVSLEGPSATMADALSTAAVFMDLPRLRQLKRDAALSRITVVSPDGDLRTI